jgi:hypothetical protein
MKRVALILTVLGIIGFAVSQVQAHDFYHHSGHYRGDYGHYGPVVVRPPVLVAPQVVVAVPVPPTVVYRPAYGYPYYAPCPRYGVYYRSRGLSLRIGF